MSSTASDKKAKKASATARKATGKKKVSRKTAPKKSKSGTAKVKKKTVAKKKTTSAKKAAGKKSTSGKKSSVKKSTKNITKKDDSTASAPSEETAFRSDVTNTTVAPEDSRSLSWMAAQAASALKAVRANQTERAQVLISKAEITPAPPAARSRKKPVLPIEPDISEDIDGSSTTTELEDTALPLETVDVASEPDTLSVAEIPQPAAREDTYPPTTETGNNTEEPEQTETYTSREKKEAEKTELSPEPSSLMPASHQAAVSGQANEPATGKTASQQESEPLAEKVIAAAVTKAADAIVPDPEETESGHTQPVPAVKDSSPKQSVIPPAHVLAETSTITRDKHPVRGLMITGIIVLVCILGISSWLNNNEPPPLATTPIISDVEKPAPVTDSKPAAEAIETVTGKPADNAVSVKVPADKAASVKVPADNWSPTELPGWPEASNSPQREQTTTTEPSAARQGQQIQQKKDDARQSSRPAAPRPGYYAPGYGYYPQQPVPPQPGYQPAYTRPSYLK